MFFKMILVTVKSQPETRTWHDVQFNCIPAANGAMVGSFYESDNLNHLVP